MAKSKVVCKNCGAGFLKENREIKRSANNFCCRSCSATYNNKAYPKRRPYHTCVDCGKKVSSTTTRCHECYQFYTREKFNSRTIEDVMCRGNGNAALYSNIRTRARTELERFERRPKVCVLCNSDRFAQVMHAAHARAIKDFPKDTLIREVNSPDNLVWLCPSHHGMVDGGYTMLP